MDAREGKKNLRKLMKARRAEMPLLDHRRKSMLIMNQCASLGEWTRSSTTHIYVSCVNNEVDTLGLIYKLFDDGVRVVVPRCVAGLSEMVPMEIRTLTELKPSRWCLMEPDYNMRSNRTGSISWLRRCSRSTGAVGGLGWEAVSMTGSSGSANVRKSDSLSHSRECRKSRRSLTIYPSTSLLPIRR